MLAIVLLVSLHAPAASAECPHPDGASPLESIARSVEQGLPQGYRLEVQTVPSPVVPGSPARLELRVFDPAGKQVTRFDELHTQTMHFILTSEDLTDFQHLHPKLDAGGALIIETTLKTAQPYDLVSEYDPAGDDKDQTSRTILLPAGARSTASSLRDELKAARTSGYRQKVGSTNVALAGMATMRAGRKENLVFTMTGKDGKPAEGLEPYMGMPGHMIVFSEDRSVFQHLHGEVAPEAGGMPGMDHGSMPMPAAMPGMDHGSMPGMGVTAPAMPAMPGMDMDHGGASPRVGFDVTFPTPGRYKVFGQFLRNGQVVTGGFVVDVR